MAATRHSYTWKSLRKYLTRDVFMAPKTCGDPLNPGSWPEVDGVLIIYILNNITDKPWKNHFALLIAVLFAHQLDVQSVRAVSITLHNRFKDLFNALNLKDMQSWQPEKYIPQYLRGEILPDHTDQLRADFWRRYWSATQHLYRWYESLPPAERDRYAQYLLPRLAEWHVDGLINAQEILAEQRRRRKEATDAIVPHFPRLRSEAHLRFNQLTRLVQAYEEALVQCQDSGASLPFSFSYIDRSERFYFRIWDRKSFVEHHPKIGLSKVDQRGAKAKRRSRYQKGKIFLEFVRAESVEDGSATEGFWFLELLRRGVMGSHPTAGSQDVVLAKREWLRAWGYTAENPETRVVPFRADIRGLLTWESEVYSVMFMSKAQLHSEGVLIPLDGLYHAAMFGLLAVSLFTTTGMRINEALQIRLSDDCFFRVTLPPPPEAVNQAPRVRYGFRLIPKGERTNTTQDYFIGAETKQLLVKTAQLLQKHYQLQPGQALPTIPFNQLANRAHRFGPGTYLFQYHHTHLSNTTLIACIRFLLHGIVFQTTDGKIIIVSPHLLRHSFATYAAHVEKLPLDVIGAMLKHKNAYVTEYYAAPTTSIVAQWTEPFLDRLAAHLDLTSTLARSPEELQEQITEAIKEVGTLHETLGGECTLHGICPIQFACIGCAAMVPDPRKRYQVQREHQRALHWVEEATQEGRYPDAERWRQHARRCEVILQEMTQMEEWQSDERQRIIIRLEPTT